jgi:hypothetical protein
MRRLVRLALVFGLAVWAWRFISGQRGPLERAGASYADGSSVVLEPGSPGFARLADAARPALGP